MDNNNNLENSIHELKQTTKIKKIYGILGIPINGEKTVEVPNRDGFVYVRLRDNTSELIQAANSEVSPVYDLPVVLIRQGGKYIIEGRDTERYQSWGSVSSFLPRHADQHSFNSDIGGGGDVVFVYGKQFVPMLAMPSGTVGANNVVLSEYSIQNGSVGWIYSGGTGTVNLLNYKPGGSNAVMILVYVDQTTGNPGIIVGSGSYFNNSITGTSEVTPYIPGVSNSDYIPAMAVRLTSGTSVIGWDNLYDVRQYYGGSGGSSSTGSSSGLSGIPVQDEGVPQGTGTVFNFVGPNVDVSVSGSVIRVFVTGSAGSSLPTFITGSVPFAGSDGILKENNPKFSFDETNGTLWVGQKYTPLSSTSFRVFLRATGSNTTVALGLVAAGTGTSGVNSPTITGYRSRGTFEVPLPSGNDDILLSLVGAGYDGVQYVNSSAIRLQANAPYITGAYTESRISFGVTPSGSNSRIDKMVLYGDSLNLINSGTYNINGVPHTHSSTGREALTSNRTYFVRTDGSDSNNGLTSGTAGAFQTIQKAIDVTASLDMSVYDVTIAIASGTYAEQLEAKQCVGAGTVYLLGDNGLATTNTVVSGATAFTSDGLGTIYNLQGIKGTGAGSFILSRNGSIVDFGNVNIANTGQQLRTDDGGNIRCVANYTISSGATHHIVSVGGTIRIQSVTVTLTGTPAFSGQFCNIGYTGVGLLTVITFSGGATGVRYSVLLNGVCYTAGGGANYFPGNSAGSTATGGQYA